MNEDLLSQPPFATFMALLDNYEPQVGVPESCGQICRDEEEQFMDEMLSSPERPMRIAHEFLVQHGQLHCRG